MPYLAADRKQHIDDGGTLVTAGDLTYIVTKLCLEQPRYEIAVAAVRHECEQYMADHPERQNYQTRCEVVGALQCARLEFRRRMPDDWIVPDEILYEAQTWFYDAVVAPYEDTKIKQNGDVFP